jgi:preprotein translocase subunit SecF
MSEEDAVEPKENSESIKEKVRESNKATDNIEPEKQKPTEPKVATGPVEAPRAPKEPLATRISNFYHNNYKALFWIPIILLILAIVQIGYQGATTGDFIKKGVAFTGGFNIEVETQYNDVVGLERQLLEIFPDGDITSRIITQAGRQKSIAVESSREIDEKKLVSALREIIGKQDPNVLTQEFKQQEFSPEFASNFFKTTITAVIIAFIFMALTVFIYFRVFIPSIAVVLAAFSDIVVTIAIFNLLGMRLAPGGIAAFLMLIGYSVDTDILLSTRTLKEKAGTVQSRINSAFRTGIVMSITSLAAVAVAFYFSQADILKQIMTVLFIGLSVDVIMTWLQNAAIIRWYIDKKGGRV